MTEAYDPNQARIDAMMDGSGISSYVARGEAEFITDDSDYPRASGNKPKRGRASHRGGRSYQEKSGRDYGREIANEEALHTVEPEQLAIPGLGRAIAQAAFEKAHDPLQAIIDRTNEEFGDVYNTIDPAATIASRERAIQARIRAYEEGHK